MMTVESFTDAMYRIRVSAARMQSLMLGKDILGENSWEGVEELQCGKFLCELDTLTPITKGEGFCSPEGNEYFLFQ